MANISITVNANIKQRGMIRMDLLLLERFDAGFGTPRTIFLGYVGEISCRALGKLVVQGKGGWYLNGHERASYSRFACSKT
jgi:hypothetical protein